MRVCGERERERDRVKTAVKFLKQTHKVISADQNHVWRSDQLGSGFAIGCVRFLSRVLRAALRDTKEEWLTVTCHQPIQQVSRYVGDETHKSEFQSHREWLVLGLHAPMNMKSKAMKT